MNEITLEHINHLSDIQLSELLHTLLRLEAEKNELQDWDSAVPFNITTADAGSDGRIRWSGVPSQTYWIKNKFTIYQNKATSLHPSKCKSEILESPKEKKAPKLKPQIKKLVESNGCYVLFTNRPIVDQGKEERIEKFREAIKEAGHINHETFQILIYDSNNIKDWANQYIKAVTLVQKFNGITRPLGFMIWEKWEKLAKAHESEYKTDEIIQGNLNLLKENIKTEKVIRVTGHSGLGKTRLVLESFRDTDLGNSLVYYDLKGDKDISEIKNYLISHNESQSGIIVLDNCDIKNHLVLSSIVKTGDITLITIGLDDDNSIEDIKIKIERNQQREVVKEIIQSKIGSTHQPSDVAYINTISEGYPWMAVRFCNIVSEKGISELNKIPIGQFIKKLIFGSNQENEIEYDIIRACSVFSAFGFVDDSFRDVINDDVKKSLQAQMDFIRTEIYDGKITSSKFKKTCNKFLNEDILERKGMYYVVKPTVLAINLASDWLINTDSDRIITIISKLKEVQLEEEFVARLKDLDQTDKAKDIVQELWGVDSLFGTAEVLNTSMGSLLFRYVVEVNPKSTAKALTKAFGTMSREELLEVKEGRRNLVWALEKLCFRDEVFTPAAKILYSFAVAENEKWGNNATNQFKQLYQLALPGTEANLDKRLDVIHWGLEKKDPDYTRIGIQALGVGLKNDSFVRIGSANKQGRSAPLRDYQPNWNEIWSYWKDSVEILTEIACSQNSHSELAKKIVAKAIRTLTRDNAPEILNAVSKITAQSDDVWSDALNNLKMTLTYEKHLSEDITNEVNRLIALLTPTDFKNQLIIKVIKPEWVLFEEDDQGKYIDRPRIQAEEFAEEIIVEKIDIEPFLTLLLSGEQRQSVYFGKRLAELLEDPLGLINKVFVELKNIEEKNQNVEFIGGLLLGAKGKIDLDKIINDLIHDPKLQKHAFYILRIMDSSYEDLLKLFTLIDRYNLPVTYFQNFQYGRALDNLKGEEVIKLCEKISKYGNAGKWTALSLVFMYSYSNSERFKESLSFFKTIISNTNLLINTDNSFRLEGHHWSVAVEKILLNQSNKDFAITISQQIVEFCNENNYNYSMESYVSKVISIMFDKYFYDIWQIFGEALIGNHMGYFQLRNLIGGSNGYGLLSHKEGVAFSNPEYHNFILEWCRKQPNIAAERIASMMPTSIKEGDNETWHPFSKKVIDEFGNNKNVLRNLSSNMGSYGITGSSVPYYKTQKSILLELKDHKIEKVRLWTEDMLEYTERAIKREQLRDEQREL